MVFSLIKSRFGRVHKVSIENIEKMMKKLDINQKFQEELLGVLRKKLTEIGENDFKPWFIKKANNLELPGEYQSEDVLIDCHERHKLWIEQEVKVIVKANGLTIDEQTLPIKNYDERAKKAYLVLTSVLFNVDHDLRKVGY